MDKMLECTWLRTEALEAEGSAVIQLEMTAQNIHEHKLTSGKLHAGTVGVVTVSSSFSIGRILHAIREVAAG
jgi:hypothetical protein